MMPSSRPQATNIFLVHGANPDGLGHVCRRRPRLKGRSMNTGQSGIFSLGTASHAYLEFDLHPGQDPHALVSAIADVREPRTTVGGVNVVSGFRPELWRGLMPDGLPAGVVGFSQNVVGADGYVMPATQHDALLWLSGSTYDVVFDEARDAINALAALASLAGETSGWPYQRFRDLTA